MWTFLPYVDTNILYVPSQFKSFVKNDVNVKILQSDHYFYLLYMHSHVILGSILAMMFVH